MEYKEYSEQLQKLGLRFMDEGTHAWERYAKSISGVAAGERVVEDVQKKYMQFAQTGGAEYMSKIMQCNIEYYMALMNANLDFSHGMIETVYKDTPCQASEADESVSTRSQGTTAQTELQFSGKKGVEQNQAFLIVNNQADNIEVSFEISDFISEDGKTKTRVPVSFKPENFVLKHGAEQVVECKVSIDKSLAEGQQSAALARVVGFPDMLIRLVIYPQV